MSDESDNTRFSRRKLLGSVATVGGAGALGGAATSALLWDEEKFGNESNPNVLQGGELDLQVDWDGTYYNWIDNPTFSSDGMVDQPGPIINLDDVKPGDVLEVTLGAHVYGNPAFLGMHYEEHANSDNGITEPEDKVNGHGGDDSDGTEGGDLAKYMNVVLWYDDGDNLIDELDDSYDSDDDGNLDVSEEEYVMDIAGAGTAEDLVGAPADETRGVFFAGTLAELREARTTFTLMASRSVSGEPADGDEGEPDFSGENGTWCYMNSTTEHIGMLAWVPRDIPGVNDNIIQTDRLEFQFGFEAIQCRHNVGQNGEPINSTIAGADAENNANSPSGNTSNGGGA